MADTELLPSDKTVCVCELCLQEEFMKLWNPKHSSLRAKAAKELETFNTQHGSSAKSSLVSVYVTPITKYFVYINDQEKSHCKDCHNRYY